MKQYLFNLFDSTLTPGNAGIKGYEYLDDIVIPLKSMKQSTKMFLKLLKEHHLRLGIPKYTQNEYFGLYVPFKEIEKLFNLQ